MKGTTRTLDVSVSARTASPDDEAYNWRFGVYNLRDVAALGQYVSDHYQAEIAGRLANTFWWDECSDGRGYGHWAIAGTLADPDGGGAGAAPNEARFRTRPEGRSTRRWLNTNRIADADFYEMIALEGVLNVGPTQVVAEFQNTWLQRDGGRDLHFHGGYAYVSYFLTGEHMPWSRRTGTLARIKPFENFFLVDRCCGGHGGGLGAWQVALRYSYADYTSQDIFGGVGEAWTLGLNWYWNPQARMQFNYVHGHIGEADDIVVAGLPAGGTYDILGMRFMIDF